MTASAAVLPIRPRSKGRRIIRVAAIAERLDTTEIAIRRRMDKGQLPHFFEGGERVMFEDELDAYLERMRAGAGVTVDQAVENSLALARSVVARGRQVGHSRPSNPTPTTERSEAR